MIDWLGRLHQPPLPFNVILVLCIWVVVGGLAWVDSFDLTDDVGIPFASAGEIVDSDSDEVREKLEAAVRTAEILTHHIMPPPTMPQVSAVRLATRFVFPSQNPPYQRWCSLRI